MAGDKFFPVWDDSWFDDNGGVTGLDFEQVLEALLDDKTPLSLPYLSRLSDLSAEDAGVLAQQWENISLKRRQALIEDLQILAEDDLLVSFEAVGRLALSDTDSKVRAGAVATLLANECESPDLATIFVQMLEKDSDADVRAMAASALGRFVYLAEVEKIQLSQTKQQVEDSLIKVVQGNDRVDVRRCALKSLGFSEREEVISLIETALASADVDWQVSALTAIGYSADERWKDQVLHYLTHPHPAVRAESARAAGELMLPEARATLFDLADDSDTNVSEAALWSLSQIGGKGVRGLLEKRLKRARDEDEIIFLETALENLDFNDGLPNLGLINVDDLKPSDLFFFSDDILGEDEDDWDEIIEEELEGYSLDDELEAFFDEDDEDDEGDWEDE